MTFWQRSSRIPPILVRMLARRRHGPPLTDTEIATASGLAPSQVFAIAQCTDWTGIDVPTMRRFLQACGVDFEDRKQMVRIDAYLRARPSWQYLRTSPLWRSYFEPLMCRYIQSRKTALNP